MNIHRLLKDERYNDTLRQYLQQTKLELEASNQDDDADGSNFEANNALAFVLNKRNALKYAPIHTAIFSRNVEAFMLLIEYGADINLKCHGSPCMHLILATAILPDSHEKMMKCFEYILSNEQLDILAKDDQNATILHLAAEYNLTQAMKIILEHSVGKEALEAKDRAGLRAIHRAAAKNSADAIKVLISHRASQSSQTSYGLTPLHIAASCGSLKAWNVLAQTRDILDIPDKWNRSPKDVARAHGWEPDQKLGWQKLVGQSADNVATAVVTHPLCRMHYTCPPSQTETVNAPPENMKRLHVILDDKDGALRSSDISEHIDWFEEPPAATMSDVLRVHEWSYIRNLQYKCERINNDAEIEGGMDSLDGDTAISKNSFKAAMHAAGSVIQAVDLVVKGEYRNAFCPVRPPGHHAGPRGLVKDNFGGPSSHGFCLLNNISIGAAYALNIHRTTVSRVAIVDFDVHHGNGTEETVRWLAPGVEASEVITPLCFGTMQVPHYKPWYDENDTNNVLFVSVHGYGPREKGLEFMMPQVAFYPGTGETIIPEVPDGDTKSVKSDAVRSTKSSKAGGGTTSEEKSSMEMAGPTFGNDEEGDGEEDDEDDEDEDEDYDVDDDDDDFSIGGEYESSKIRQLRQMYKTAPKTKQKAMPPLILDVGVTLPEEGDTGSGAYRHQWRNYFRDEIFPRLLKFEPDMIFISAGFDAHRKDTINSGYIALVEEDFEWVTNNLIQIANTCCNGRIVSALEGGYQIGGEHYSSFAKSVKSHVMSLAKGGRSTRTYKQEESDKEKEIENTMIEEVNARKLAKLEAQQAAMMREASDETAGGVAIEEESSPREESARKRRRADVDYAKLDQELFAKKD